MTATRGPPAGDAGGDGGCGEVGVGRPAGPPWYSGSPKRTYCGATGSWRVLAGSCPKVFLRISGTVGVFTATWISATPTLCRSRLDSDLVTIVGLYCLSL